MRSIIGLSLLAFASGLHAQGIDRVDTGAPSINITTGGAWREARSVVATYEMTCPSDQVLRLKVKRSKDGIGILELSADGKPASADLVKEIEATLTAMGGFDYPYALCAKGTVWIAFDAHERGAEPQSAGWTLK